MRAGKRFSVRKTAGLLFGQSALFVLAILAVCVATPLHTALLRAFGAAERSGFAWAEVEAIARAMVDVMKGADREILAHWFTADEVLHMKDVQWIFGVGLKLLGTLAVLSALCLIGGKKPGPSEARAAFGLSLLLPAAVAVPFAVDFNRMFIWLHRVAFPDNELWLMDPRIHKMVVVYDGQFFVAAVAIIGIACALSIVPLAVYAVRGKKD